MSLAQRKYEIIQAIVASDQEDLLRDVSRVVERYGERSVRWRIDLSPTHTNIEPEVDLERIKRERPIAPLDIDAFFVATRRLKWDQSVEELAAQLD